MQKEDPQFWEAVVAQIMASGIWSALAFGAAGGATNALVTKVSRRDAIRLILLGALVAAGMGSLTMAALVAWFSLPPELVPIGGASGSGAYLMGVFGSAIIEVILARLHKGKLPSETGGEDV